VRQTNESPAIALRLQDIVKSLQIKFETNDFDIQWVEKSGSVLSAFVEVECKDLSNMLGEDVCSVEIVLKNLESTVNGDDEESYHPVNFKLLGFHLQRERIGAKLSGSRFQWVPKIEELLIGVVPAIAEMLFSDRYVVLFIYLNGKIF